MIGPLSGITVLDLTHVLAGPFSTMLMGDLGAEIIKVEPPGEGDHTRGVGPVFAGDQSAYFLAVNRNKKGIVVNLKHPGGVDVLKQLAMKADVIIDNFRPGALKKMGIDYDDLRAANPRLVSVSVTATGSTGAYAELAGYDLMIQAMGGIMAVTGPKDGDPYRVGLPIADMLGGIYAGFGILAALRERDATGHGRHIDLSLLDAEISLLSYVATQTAISGNEPKRHGNGHSFAVPYDSYETAAGQIVIAVPSDRFWPGLCRALERPDLAADSRYDSEEGRNEHRDELTAQLNRTLMTADAFEWEKRIRAAGVPCSRVRGIRDILADPETTRRGMLRSYEHPTAGRVPIVNNPIRFGDDPGPVPTPAPLLGEHTRDILSGVLGLGEPEIDALVASGAVSTVSEGGHG